MPLDTATSTSPDQTLPVNEILEHCNKFKGGSYKNAFFQLITTLTLFSVCCALMFYGINASHYWLSALLLLPTSGLLIRIFIFQHDCGHGSFLPSQKGNRWVGRILGLLTFTPYDFWRRAHNMHHATSGNLDQRSIGGIDTITVKEYEALSKWKKLAYRIYRHPLVLLIFGTPFYTIVLMRIPMNQSTAFHEGYKTLPVSSTWKSIMSTNAGIIAFYGTLSYFVGLSTLAIVYLPILIITAWVGGWLFYIQHQFEDTYWENNENWNINEAGLAGSSYYALPKVFQWFTGNIGLHHIHHLCLKIPNYKLQECMDAYPELENINRLTFKQSLASINMKLWDEDQKKLVSLPN